MENAKLRLVFKVITFDHDGYCSSDELEAEEHFEYEDIRLPDYLREYNIGDEIPDKALRLIRKKHEFSRLSGYCGSGYCIFNTDEDVLEKYKDIEIHSKNYILDHAYIIEA